MPRNPDKTDYSQGFPEGFEVFASIRDPRDGGHTLHHFGEILFIAFAAVLCGVRSYELMEEFGELREDWLRKWLELPNSIPCGNTFSRVFQAIEPTAFATCIAEHLARLGFAMEGGQIAIDGKALRGSRSGETTHLHAVSAWACEAGITLGQAFVGEKTNEITAIPQLLEMLNLKGAVVTIDAMGTQRAIAEKIVKNGGDYILSVKGNQGLACLMMVHRHTLLGAGKTRSETSYYMSSLKDVHAPAMLGYVRGHWAIENSCHWVLDAIYREDHNQTRDRNSAANHSILRRMALNAHNRMPFEGKKRKSLPKRELRATYDSDYLEKLLSLM